MRIVDAFENNILRIVILRIVILRIVTLRINTLETDVLERMCMIRSYFKMF